MSKENLNADQLALLKWITSGLSIKEVRNLHGDAGYLLSNMIAKFTLAAPSYRLSVAAYEKLKDMGVDLRQPHKRSKFYGKQSPFMYEHSVPCSLVRRHLLSIKPSIHAVQNVLLSAGTVVMILRSEDDKLRTAGLARSMPDGWQWGNDPLARYRRAKIPLSRKSIMVDGAIER